MSNADNLAKANQLKRERQELRREVMKLPLPFARLAVAAILERNPECIHNCQIGFMLQWMDRMGIQKIETLLMEVGAVWSDLVSSDTYRADAMTPYQRLLLIEKLRNDRLTPYDEFLDKLRGDDTHGTGD